jgi:hypothetical protein
MKVVNSSPISSFAGLNLFWMSLKRNGLGRYLNSELPSQRLKNQNNPADYESEGFNVRK